MYEAVVNNIFEYICVSAISTLLHNLHLFSCVLEHLVECEATGSILMGTSEMKVQEKQDGNKLSADPSDPLPFPAIRPTLSALAVFHIWLFCKYLNKS